MKGYKGFNSKLQCTTNGNVFQYEIGKEYETDEAKCCEKGFHFCEFPLDVFKYYTPADSRYCEVEGDGTIDRGDDSKVAVSKIKIGAEIGLKGLIEAGVKFILEKVNWNNAKESNNEERSAATNTGYRSVATNTGNWSVATVEGKESVAVSIGIEGKAKGHIGCWLILAEWEFDEEQCEWHRKDVQCRKVDGEVIKADTFYVLKDGQFIKAEE